MIRSNRILTFLCAGTLFLWSCGGGSTSNDQPEGASDEAKTLPKIKLTKAPASPAYDDAVLTLVEPAPDQVDTGAVSFEFSVSNYELGIQTEDAAEKGIANSGKGQHIHFILNNGPYSAHYEPGFEKNLDPGNYTILAFLSRSYHESVKNPSSFAVKQLTVGDGTPDTVDFAAKHMFYSRPKGTYSGADTEKVLLDFFLLNTTLSEDGNKVRATINGEEFMITEWVPHLIENAPIGELKVKLELLDASGAVIPGPFNVVERTVKLEE